MNKAQLKSQQVAFCDGTSKIHLVTYSISFKKMMIDKRKKACLITFWKKIVTKYISLSVKCNIKREFFFEIKNNNIIKNHQQLKYLNSNEGIIDYNFVLLSQQLHPFSIEIQLQKILSSFISTETFDDLQEEQKKFCS